MPVELLFDLSSESRTRNQGKQKEIGIRQRRIQAKLRSLFTRRFRSQDKQDDKIGESAAASQTLGNSLSPQELPSHISSVALGTFLWEDNVTPVSVMSVPDLPNHAIETNGSNAQRLVSSSLQELHSQALPIASGSSSSFSDREKSNNLVPVPGQALADCTDHDRTSLWGLDMEGLIQEIEEWKIRHPDKKLVDYLKNICNQIDTNSALLELFPDGSIPIRGLVKCFVYFFKLGTVAVWAEDKAIELMQELIPWLEELAHVYKKGELREREKETWKVLGEMGKLIEDACHWARELLSSEVAPTQRLSVESKIQDYRTRFTRISERFSIISQIQMAKGLDDMVDRLASVGRGIDDVSRDLNKISNNDDAAAKEKRLDFLRKQLLAQSRLIDNASYIRQHKRPCESGTRVDILREIILWIEDVAEEESQCFYWLSGAPGVGKSAITASIAKHCVDSHILGAQFFIDRDDATTTDPHVLFPSICWQLCGNFQEVLEEMERTLDAKPSLIDEISDDQAMQLFVKAIEVAAAKNRSRAVVIVIDALDEIDSKRLWDLANILSKVVPDLPRNAKVFISSRAEDAITKPFNLLCNYKRVKSRYLAAAHSIEEVSEFMKRQVDQILKRYNMSWDDWGDENMEKLSARASGLYIWAETALKFIRNEIENSGTTCVGELLKTLTAKGMDDMNALYLTILRQTCKPGDWEYQRFRRIIGAIIVRQTPLSIADMGQLLDLKDPAYLKPVDLIRFVRQYRTILVNDTREINGLVVPRMHKSFVDFVTSEKAEEFLISKFESHGELALQCISQIDGLMAILKFDNKKSKGSFELPTFPAQLVYFSQYWQIHLTRMVELGINDSEEKNEYGTLDILELPNPTTEGLPTEPFSLEDLKPDIVGRVSSFAFSPDGTQFAHECKVPGTIHLRDTRTGSVAMFLTGHHDNVTSIGFSPDGRQLVSASEDCTTRIWDTWTRTSQLHVLYGHTNRVRYATFSHDGKTVATCSEDETLRSWDARTGQQLRIFRGHEDPVLSCMFSLDDQRIASFSLWNNGEILVWDLKSGNIISKFEHKSCRFMSFCPCGNHIMSCDRNGKIMLWDAAESGKQLNRTNFTTARLAFVEESEQRSANKYIEVPQAICDRDAPYMYFLNTQHGTLYGIVEHGQGVWELLFNDRRRKLRFAAGVTTMSML